MKQEVHKTGKKKIGWEEKVENGITCTDAQLRRSFNVVESHLCNIFRELEISEI